MDACPEDAISIEFRRECSIRRTSRVLEAKRKRIRDDLQQLVKHMGLLVPSMGISEQMTDSRTEVLKDALDRLGDESFTQFVLQIVQELR